MLSRAQFKRARLNPIAAVVKGAMVLCLSQSASALELAPYFEAWGSGTLTQAQQAAGLQSATLAFAITSGTCTFRVDLLNKLPDARNFVAAGGRLIISLGGAEGTYAEIACTDDDQLYNLLDKLMVDAGVRRLDFDVEGPQLQNTTGTARRARVLARLQAKYPDLYVSFTLPGWLNGLNTDSLNLLKTTAAAGVQIDMVNLMTMSFGVNNINTLVVPPTVAQAAMVTFRAAATQMATIFPDKTQAQLHAMMGMTPMIGKNDDGSTLSLAEAQTIADFVKTNGIGFLSYWSFQRDKAQASSGMTPINTYSGVAQSAYQFYNIFKTAGDYVLPPPPPPPAPAPAPAPTCAYPAWVNGATYLAGSIVTYTDGKLYIAKFANPGYNPTISTYYWSVYTHPAWVAGKYYAAGSIVTYKGGKAYIAKYANPGYDPTISTYFWAPYGC